MGACKLYISLLLIAFSFHPAASQQTKKIIPITAGFPTMGFLEYFPPGYHDNTSKLYPLIVFLHGSGEMGSGSLEDLEKVKSWGPPSHIDKGHNMCFTVNGVEECFVVLSPQLASQYWLAYIGQLLDYVAAHPETYRIDPRRVYITGLSLGGQLTYDFSTSLIYRNYTPAAIAPMSARWNTNLVGCRISARKIAVWGFHGRLDTIVPYSDGERAFSAVNDCKDPVATAEMKFTTYEERYHDAWIPGYDPGHAYHEPNVYEWFLTQVREPEQIVSAEHEGESKTTLYPNPASHEVHIDYDEKEVTSLAIHTLTSVNIKQIPGGIHRIDISDLVPGVYMLRLTSRSGTTKEMRLVKLD